MSLMGWLGLALTMISVLAAYQVGFRAGFREGRDEGFEDGKKAGSKAGSMRGYAVGYDRGRRSVEEPDEEAPQKKSMPSLLILVAIVGAIWILVNVTFRRNPPGPNRALPPGSNAWNTESTSPQR